MKKLFIAFCLVAFVSISARGQWLDQSFALKPGWNAIYTHIDAAYATLDNLITGAANPVTEIWLWNPAHAPDRFMSDPATPADGIDWLHWVRDPAVSDTLNRLIPNAAYLVFNSGSVNYTWIVRGRPVPPRYSWTSKGVNLIGFSTPTVNPPIFANFLFPAQEMMTGAEFFRYVGGPLTANPAMFNGLLNSLRAQRGEAYWVKWPNHFNTYFGAFNVSLQSESGIDFDETLSRFTMRLENKTAATITVTLALYASLAPPAGLPSVAGVPPLLRRGELNTTNLIYSHSNFSAPQTVTLAPAGQPASIVELMLGLDRSAMPGAPGDLYAGALRVTDSLGYSQVDLPVTATVSSKAGLWVGDATITQVRHYLKNYEAGPDGKPLISSNGTYNISGINTNLGPVARPFPLRLILHHGTNGATRLLQRAYAGLDRGSNSVLATRQNILHPNFLSEARRISATHLPWSEDNNGWAWSGNFSQGQTMTTTVRVLNDEQASNPFLHTYHPDHDNLNATFDFAADRGLESYDVVRTISLQLLPLATDFMSVTSAGSQVAGSYSEALAFEGRGAERRVIYTQGAFKLNRISGIESLTTEP